MCRDGQVQDRQEQPLAARKAPNPEFDAAGEDQTARSRQKERFSASDDSAVAISSLAIPTGGC